jgi:spermidine synthase
VVSSFDADLQVPQLGLVVDGKMDATSVGDLPTQVLLGQIPLFLKPDAKDVFVLGLGSGVTAGSVLTHPVERVDCVEIAQGVVDAAKRFGETNGRPEEDPRFHLTVDDGKTVMAATRRNYDVIISEPTNPWISGVGNLFSRESFQATAQALKPGGLAAQWFHGYQLDDPLAATIIRTFRTVFPNTVIFQGAAADYILIGSLQPFPVSFAAMEARLREPKVAQDLARLHITRLPALLALQTHTVEAAAALEQGGGINTDDFPLLETRAPHAHYLGHLAQRIEQTDCRFTPGQGLILEHYLRGRQLDRQEYEVVLDTLSDPRMGSALYYRVLHEFLRRWPDDVIHLKNAARYLETNGRVEQALPYARRAAAAGDPEGKALAARLSDHLRRMESSVFAPPAK